MTKIYALDEARHLIHTLSHPPHVQVLPLIQTYGHVLAQDTYAKVDMPPFSRAMMDGYAVHSQDAVPGTILQIIDQIAAGDEPKYTVNTGQAIRIMTGAPIPEGADAVIRQEWCELLDEQKIRILRQARIGESIQNKGEDGYQGDFLLAKGTRITGTEMAILKTFGISNLSVTTPPSVSILITGSELIQEVTDTLPFGRIYGANDLFLSGALQEDGIYPKNIQYVPDDPHTLKTTLQTLAEQSNYLIVTGGVSAGDFDFVPSVIKQLTPSVPIEKIWMRPGSPFIAAVMDKTVIFGLSGNPGAAYTQFEMLVRPAIRASLGFERPLFTISAKLCSPLTLPPIKHTRILRAKAVMRESEIWVDTDFSQSPGLILSLASANCLIRLDKSNYSRGEHVPVHAIRNLT